MKDAAASVHDRLLNMARSSRQDFNALLDQYGAERLLYRIAESPHASRFVLKGAQLLMVHAATTFRPTRDIDLLGRGENDVVEMAAVFKEICSTSAPDDGLSFNPATITVGTIGDETEYPGLRVTMLAHLGNARLKLRVDIGFGDVLTPEPSTVTFPTLLDHPSPVMRGYPLATVVAEKLEILGSRGITTTRMKDLYDLWFVLTNFELKEGEVREAIARTFERRATRPDPDMVAFTSEFWEDPAKLTQWEAFRNRLGDDVLDLPDVCTFLVTKLRPILVQLKT